MSDSIILRRWAKLDYKDPSALLKALRPLQIAVAMSELPEKTKGLRGAKQKTHREIWQATLFAHAMSVALDYQTLEFAILEDEDYDCVVRWIAGDTINYAPVQLKEIVPVDVNPTASIEDELSKLSKYATSPRLVVAIFLNRAGQLDLSKIKIPSLPIGELWFFGNASSDQTKWLLYGDVLSKPTLHEIVFPT